MSYPLEIFPFEHRHLSRDDILVVSRSGDFAFLRQSELAHLRASPNDLPLDRVIELKSKFFLGDPRAKGMARLLKSRQAAKSETVAGGPSLHIFVVTLLCEHSCRYCQVSRAVGGNEFSMSHGNLDAACDSIFQSPSRTLTVEFQGGDPLVRFDLVRCAIERIESINASEHRNIRFVIASTLHQLDEECCAYLRMHNVFLSTSIDGPAAIHNRNRPLPTRDSYERTVRGIDMARRLIDANAVSALMTTTRDSLACPENIIDEYVKLGFREIFLRPLSLYGFAKRNESHLGYPMSAFHAFYERAFERILHWNREGVPIREVAAAIALNKMLSPFDAGYINLQSPTGAGLACLVYNYDGYVYPSDEARMLAETGDCALRLGPIGQPLRELLESNVERALIASSIASSHPGCADCAYNRYCGPDPIGAHAEHGSFAVAATETRHCVQQMWLFDFLFRKLREADSAFEDLAYDWAMPPDQAIESCRA